MQHKKRIHSISLMVITLLLIVGVFAVARTSASADHDLEEIAKHQAALENPFKEVSKRVTQYTLATKITSFIAVCLDLPVEINCHEDELSAIADKITEYNEKVEQLSTQMETAVTNEDTVLQKSLKAEYKVLRKEARLFTLKALNRYRSLLKQAVRDHKNAVTPVKGIRIEAK